MLRRVMVLGLVILCAAADAASAQSILVSFDPSGGYDACGATIPGPMPVTWYLLAQLGGPVQSGIVGAEFRQVGTPAGWVMTATPSALASIALGDPLQGGAQIGFPTCQTGTDGIVLLYTVQGFATSTVGCTVLWTTRHTNYSNPSFACPVLVQCYGPAYTYVCAAGGEAYINAQCGDPVSCPVAVTPTRWAQVKSLYQ